MVRDRMYGQLTGKKRCVPPMAGLTAGISLSLVEMDTISYTGGTSWIQKATGRGKRFVTGSRMLPKGSGIAILRGKRIGRSMSSQAIPLYLGIHAHVVNILFVLLLIGILVCMDEENESPKAGSCGSSYVCFLQEKAVILLICCLPACFLECISGRISGFCYLFCSYRRSDAVWKYCMAGRQDPEDPAVTIVQALLWQLPIW